MKKFKFLIIILIVIPFSCADNDEDTIETTVSVSDFSTIIDEYPNEGFVLGIVEAATNQGSLTYSITQQSSSNAIAINSSTGELTVLTESLFDFETNPIITGIVKVENGDISDSANITITLNDINDTTVSVFDFEATIDENPNAGLSLGFVEATTNQGSLTYSITEQFPNNALAIDSSTGELTVLTETLFNFETNPTITGIVQVENGDISDTANITINLNDVNEQSLQERLDNGETPCDIYQSDNSLLDGLYGLTYQGGLIFYLNTNDCTGLLATSENQTYNNYEITDWGCENINISGAEYSTIGSGSTNTNAILSNCPSIGIAAEVCNSLQLNGFSDWFLPSKDELNLMYTNLHLNGLGNFKESITVHIPNSNGGTDIHYTIYYWSSTQSSDYNNMAWVQTFSDGSQYDVESGIKSFKHMIRAVRSF